MKKIFCFFFIFIASFALSEQSYTSFKVIDVHDGDTVKILYGNDPVSLRLDGIDSPELDQPFGGDAQKFLSKLVFEKNIFVFSKGQDKYHRVLATIFLESGENVNQLMVKNGFAWWYREYSNDESLQALENEAKEKHCGLWKDVDPTPPWDFRHSKRNGSFQNYKTNSIPIKPSNVQKSISDGFDKFLYVSSNGFYHKTDLCPNCKYGIPCISKRAKLKFRSCPLCYP